jgi:hypothetical protein
VEAVVARICRHGALDGADTDSTVISILLPRGVVLVDGFSPRIPAAAASPNLPRHRMAPAAAPAGTVRSQHH